MNEAEFDKFADEYYVALKAGLAVSGEDPEFFSEYKIKDIARALGETAQRKAADLRVLDFGAGIGNSVPFVHRYLPQARLTCLDLSQRSLQVAEQRFPGLADYVHFDGKTVPFPDEMFDVAYAMCVFHHIPEEEHVSLLRELCRATRPDGSVFIFEHNPYNPLTTRIVKDCPFDENARLIRAGDMKKRLLAAGFRSAEIAYRVFFPNALRALRPAEAALTWLPLGGQYFVRAVR